MRLQKILTAVPAALVALVLPLGASTCQQVSAAPVFSQKPCDATYEMDMDRGTLTQRRISDGKGNTRVELLTPEGKMVTILNAPQHTAYTLMPRGKMAMKIVYGEGQMGKNRNFIVDSKEKAAKMHAEPLGAKIVEGHPCHGFQYITEKGKNEVWLGDDVGTMVLMTTTGEKGKTMVMKLKSYKPFNGDESLFQVPAGYRVMANPMAAMLGGGFPGAAGGNMQMPTAGAPEGNSAQPRNPMQIMNAMRSGRNPFASIMQNRAAGGGMSPQQIEKMKQWAESMKRAAGQQAGDN